MSTSHSDPRRIYTPHYAEQYPGLYITPWTYKHDLNVRNLDNILRGLRRGSPRWLDLACGQAWHFAQFPNSARMVGIDISLAQLLQARRHVVNASLVCADMTTVQFPPASFDLVTNFWAGYCYLGNPARITSLIRSAIEWLSLGGVMYIEVLLGRDLATFNRSAFSEQTGFVVRPRCDDFTEWEYEDIGGLHVMASPPLENLIDILSPRFSSIECKHDGSFMNHVIARDRR